MNKVRMYAVVAMVVLCGVGAYANTILLEDTYTVSANSSDENFEISRQTGTLAPISYTQNSGASYQTQVGHPVHPGGLAIFAGILPSNSDPNQNWYVSTSPDYDFNGYDDLDYHVAITPMITGSFGDATNWASLVIGDAKGAAFYAGGSKSIGVLVRGNGGYQIFVDGVAVVNGDSTPLAGTTHDVDVNVRQVSASEYRLSVALNGTDVLTDSLMSYVPTAQYVSLVGAGPNGMAGSSYDQHGFDDLSVTYVPEPVTMLLMVLGGVSAIIRRR